MSARSTKFQPVNFITIWGKSSPDYLGLWSRYLPTSALRPAVKLSLMISHIRPTLIRSRILDTSFKRGFFAESHVPPIDEFKHAMSTVGSQAMILTSSFTGKADINQMHGTTLGSVSSLTVYPEPIIQFNIQIPSATSKSMHENKYMALHMLSPSIESVKLARTFSLGSKYINQTQHIEDQPESQKFTTPFGRIEKDQWDLFENVIHNERPDAFHITDGLHLPILTKHSERILICEKYKVFQVYNHEIWTCRVKDILVNVEDNAKTGGLLYFNRNFHNIGDPLHEHKHDTDN